ncbi:hypothetical protein PILCRDRAFT_814986 [Piloderma croceum F 1598]|uniref:Ketoreductase (KR) domain-containing protein n=1 Tax=Piloderma croceum (strain F 1598) TaxID=765440 RepID=A0A0C3G6L1_PILCF|nr:hypothetical protein PILCRDRAFT_814986 [Piloderma croceum F 1598]
MWRRSNLWLIVTVPILFIINHRQHVDTFVTGSNQGLGFETARHLPKYPHVHLFVSGQNLTSVQEALEKITKEEDCKAVVDSVVIDVVDDDSIKAGVKEVEIKLNGAGLDVLVVSSPWLALSNNSPLDKCVYAEQRRRCV